MKNKLFMKCGHTSQATKDGKPICVICYPSIDSTTVVKEPDLTGRSAKCTMCGRKVESLSTLPFFNYRKNSEYDQYYCGCRGWS